MDDNDQDIQDTVTDDEDRNYSEQVWRILLIHQKQIGDILVTTVSAVTQAIMLATQRKEAIPYHTSILTGEGWVKELINGHPERICSELGVHKQVFFILVAKLQDAGYTHSRHVKIEEQLAIFLYTCVTGLTLWHVAERFQRSVTTISKYFKTILFAFSSEKIYNKYIQLPCADNLTPDVIKENVLFWLYFKDVIGAIDGTHIPCTASAEERDAARNRKGFMFQNCLICCSFDLKFTYVLSGWEGSAADATVYHNACINNLTIPPNKCYLADAGFPSCPELLMPFRGERYHLAEWGRAQLRPVNRWKYFNLRHAQLCNVIERIIGVVKRCFRILIVPPEFSMEFQARIPPVCCCMHNIIRVFDEEDLEDMEPGDVIAAHLPDELGESVYGTMASGVPTSAGCDLMATKHDQIAMMLWADYA